MFVEWVSGSNDYLECELEIVLQPEIIQLCASRNSYIVETTEE